MGFWRRFRRRGVFRFSPAVESLIFMFKFFVGGLVCP